MSSTNTTNLLRGYCEGYRAYAGKEPVVKGHMLLNLRNYNYEEAYSTGFNDAMKEEAKLVQQTVKDANL